MNEQNMSMKIDEELSRYETLTNEIKQLEDQIKGQLKTYNEVMQSYNNAVKIILPKMKLWSNERRAKVTDLSEKIKQKWEYGSLDPKYDPQLEQENQLFEAIYQIHFKRPYVLRKFIEKRTELLKEQLDLLDRK